MAERVAGGEPPAPQAIAGLLASSRGARRVRDDRRVTIVFRLPSAAAERVAFSYSLAMEAVLSLHVLVEPKHHPVQHEWVRAMRRLSPALKREVDVFAFAYRAYFPESFFPPAAGELSDFESELRRLRGVDERLVRLEFAIPLVGSQPGEEIPRDPAALEAPGTLAGRRRREPSSARHESRPHPALMRPHQERRAGCCDGVAGPARPG